jgi:hypothetical protein
MSARVKFDPVSILLILGTFLTWPLKTFTYGVSVKKMLLSFMLAFIYC